MAYEIGGAALPVIYWVIAGLALSSLVLHLAGVIGYGWPVVLVLLSLVVHLIINAGRIRR